MKLGISTDTVRRNPPDFLTYTASHPQVLPAPVKQVPMQCHSRLSPMKSIQLDRSKSTKESTVSPPKWDRNIPLSLALITTIILGSTYPRRKTTVRNPANFLQNVSEAAWTQDGRLEVKRGSELSGWLQPSPFLSCSPRSPGTGKRRGRERRRREAQPEKKQPCFCYQGDCFQTELLSLPSPYPI